MALDRLRVQRRSGAERFHNGSHNLDVDLLSFWQWSGSDIISNATRGVIAEYIVALALDVDVSGIREEWAAYDLTTSAGIKIEVKSAAYVQSWFQKTFSRISFRIPKTLAWDADTNKQSSTPCRQADVYVFALLAHKDKPTVSPLNVSQWQFYVLATEVLNARARSQHSIMLRTLEKLTGDPLKFVDVKQAVEKAYNR